MAEYNNASASKCPFNYANRLYDVRPAIIKLFNSWQAPAANGETFLYSVTRLSNKTKAGTSSIWRDVPAHIKLDRRWSSTLFLFESHENMKRVCSFTFRQYDSAPFYSQVNVYEFVNKHGLLHAVTFAI